MKEVYVGGRKIPSYEEWEYSKNHVNVLGTAYKIETHKVSEDEYMQKNQLAGYCCEESKLIVIADMSEKEYFTDMDEREQDIYRKKTLRHELIHAFLNESGLSDSASVPAGSWAKHEEMVDWFAIQFPKMLDAFKKAGCLDSPINKATEALDKLKSAMIEAPIGISELGQKITSETVKKANPFFYSLSDEEKEFVNSIATQIPISCEDVAKIFVIRGNGNREITKRFLYTEYGFIVE